MERVLARLASMNADDRRLPGVPETTPLPQSGAAPMRRRAALDVSIDDELLRGELRGAELSDALRLTLSALVEHELATAEPLTEKEFLENEPIGGPFPSTRKARRLETLISQSLARREDGRVRPTVAGVAAIMQISALPDSEHPPRELLRALRQSEIDGIRL